MSGKHLAWIVMGLLITASIHMITTDTITTIDSSGSPGEYKTGPTEGRSH